MAVGHEKFRKIIKCNDDDDDDNNQFKVEKEGSLIITKIRT
jgi:hypothetical protein